MSAWADGIRQLHKEAAGVLEFYVVQREDITALLQDPVDDRDHPVMRLVNQTLHRVQNPVRGEPMLCACCPRPLRDGAYAIVATIPARDDARHGLTLGICTRCATTHAAIRQRATEALRRIWPDVRQLTITHPEGGQA